MPPKPPGETPMEENAIAAAPTPETPVVPAPEPAKRGRPSRSEEFAAYTKALRTLTLVAQTLGGFDQVRTLIDVLESSSKAA